MRAWVLLIVCVGCTDLSEFALDDGEIYRGEVVGQDDGTCVSGEVCSFIRRGFAAGTALELDFDPDQATSTPGTLTTHGEPCGPTFDGTPLLPIPALSHDQLSLYDFPGGARLQNYIFVARPDSGPLTGRDAMVFVSLLRGDNIEVRVIAGPGRTDCAATDCAAFDGGTCDYFGLFNLGVEAL